MKRFIILLALVILFPVAVSAQGVRQAAVYFRAGDASIDMLWNGNDKAVPDFLSLMNATVKTPSVQVDSVVVLSYTSPEGSRWANDLLSEKRAGAVEAFLRKEVPGIRDVSVRSVGEDWAGFAAFLKDHPEIPQAELIRQLISQTPDVVRDETGRAVSSRKKEVMDVLSEQEWNDMKVSVFPALRRADIFFYYSEKNVQKESVKPSVKEEPQAVAEAQEQEGKKIDIGGVVPEEKVVEQIVPVAARRYASTAVVGTNVLLDALTVPNISLEFPFGRHWSVGGGVLFPAWTNWRPWWRNDVETFSQAQAVLGNVQLSYYFIPWYENDNRVLRGPYIRAFGYGGAYNFEHRTSKEVGIMDQGHYFATGLSVGAAIPLSQWLRLDVSAGFGPSWTLNKHYVNYDIQGKPILIDESTTLKWKSADAQIGVKYIIHKAQK